MDNTHLLATHDTPQLQTIFGSDILRLTPPEVFAHVYCLDENKVKDALKPLKQTVIIGPPADCQRENEVDTQTEVSHTPVLTLHHIINNITILSIHGNIRANRFSKVRALMAVDRAGVY